MREAWGVSGALRVTRHPSLIAFHASRFKSMTTFAASFRARLHYAWVILAMGTLVVFGSLGLGRFGYGVILPAMQKGLGLSNTQAGAMVTASLLGYLVLSVAGGMLAARFGPRIVISAGLLLSGVGMLLTGTAGGFGAALLSSTLMGIGSGASNVPVMALLSAWFGKRQRGLASGIAVGGSSIGMILVGPTAPRILSAFGDSGWRVSWYLFGATTLALAAASYLLLRTRPDEIGLPPSGADSGQVQPPPKPAGLQWGRVYRSTAVWHLGLVYIAFGFSYIIFTTFFAKYLMAEGGYTKEAAGGLFMLLGWFSLACGLIWGAVSDAIGRKWALTIVYLVHATAFGLFGLWPTPAGFTLAAAIFGLAAWSIPAIMSATCGDILGPQLAPAALGFITLFFGLGQTVGPSVAGAIADAWGTFAPAFVLASIVSLLGAGGALMLRPPPAAELPEAI